MASFGTLKEGYLTKSGENLKSWKKRYFLIQDDLIFYFGKKKNMQAKGAVKYADIVQLTPAGDEIKKKKLLCYRDYQESDLLCICTDIFRDGRMDASHKNVAQPIQIQRKISQP
eukprot:TRINITY_DN11794_c0_g1_i1.p1 TRINITY_DN11794_c0_g1~~TRINITY_DN11794_c0_g1_i1.p1  ORF type:complete len:114 (-),score=13.63 TRINITY_DN11794_c0_g1_i1:181-522(-)